MSDDDPIGDTIGQLWQEMIAEMTDDDLDFLTPAHEVAFRAGARLIVGEILESDNPTGTAERIKHEADVRLLAHELEQVLRERKRP